MIKFLIHGASVHVIYEKYSYIPVDDAHLPGTVEWALLWFHVVYKYIFIRARYGCS
jgi:hypothetical protein